MQFAVPISKCVYIHSYGYIGPRGYTQLWMLSPLLLPMWISTAAPSDFHDDPPIIQLLVDVHPGGWFDMIYPPFQAIPDCLLMLPQTYQKNYGPMGTPLCLRSLWHSFKPTICKVHGFAVPWWRKLWRNPVKLILDFPYWNSRSSDDKKVLLVLFTLFEVFVISILRGYCNWWASFLYFFGVLFRRPASVYSPMGSWATSTATLHCMAQHIYYYI